MHNPFSADKLNNVRRRTRRSTWLTSVVIDAKTLDIAIAGWILRAHPRYHIPDKQCTLMEKKMKDWWKSLDVTAQMYWSAKLTADENGDLNVPPYRRLLEKQSVLGADSLAYGYFHQSWVPIQQAYLCSQGLPCDRRQAQTLVTK
jgi:hypothetical protein